MLEFGKKIISFVFVFVLFGIFGFALARSGALDSFITLFDVSSIGILEAILLLTIPYYFAIIIHELGHLVMGKLTGYNFMSFRFLSFMIIRKQNGTFSFQRYSIPGTAGQCLMFPAEHKKIGIFWYNFGGVFFNLISFLLALGIFLSSRTDIWKQWMFLMMLYNGLFIFVNWIPLKNVQNDGKNYQELKLNPISRLAFKQMLLVNRDLSYGMKLSDLGLFPNREALDYRQALQSSILLIYALQDLYRLDFDAYTSEMNRCRILIHNQKGWLVNLTKPYLYFADLLTNPETAVATKDKTIKTILKAMKHDPFYSLVAYYETLVTNSKDSFKFKAQLIKSCQKVIHHGEAQEVLNLLPHLEARAYAPLIAKSGVYHDESNWSRHG